jgi:tRNA-splicing ligase RtcB (3'-phosphate/5'-hydroxy nucleic acid ligase)
MHKISPKLYSWASILEDNTRAQAELTATMPFVSPHLALMPDAHLGLGSTVGSVIPTVGAIMPAAVGVDIGCGMIAVRTQFKLHDIEDRDLATLRQQIERSIPLSAGNYNGSISETALPRIHALEDMRYNDRIEAAGPWRRQLGSLGSGNHFIEVSYDEEDRIWLFLHSGSRGVGNKLATMHVKQAVEDCKNRGVELPNRDLAYLCEGDVCFDNYINDMQWAQHFALLNREEMMDRVVREFEFWLELEDIQEEQRINCHHNYTTQYATVDNDVLGGYRAFWLTRKGAISAHRGELGLIPGSMGTASYVVEGLGNADALWSAPHGAGRNFSRTQARKTFTIEDLRARMTGIEWRDSAAFLDEHPDAYKDIDVVMRDAADLVTIRHTLHQLVNVKGN